MTNTNNRYCLEPRDLKTLKRLAPDGALFHATDEYRAALSHEAIVPGYRENRRFKLRNRFQCCADVNWAKSSLNAEFDHGCTATHIAYVNGIGGRAKDILQFSRLMDKYCFLQGGLPFSEKILELSDGPVANEADAISGPRRANSR